MHNTIFWIQPQQSFLEATSEKLPEHTNSRFGHLSELLEVPDLRLTLVSGLVRP